MMTIAHTEMLDALAHVRGSFERQLAGAGRYRALRNIEDTLVDLIDDEAIVQPLNGVRDLLIHRLQERPDFRALRTIDTIIPQLLDVLSLHAQQMNSARSDAQANSAAPDDGELSVSEDEMNAVVVSAEATETLPASDVGQTDHQSDVSQQPIAATDGADAPDVESTQAPTNNPAANGIETEALAPIVPQSFNFGPVIVPALAADTTDITNEPVDEQTSGAPHRLDADDARTEERAA